jgi:hypothetical protein
VHAVADARVDVALAVAVDALKNKLLTFFSSGFNFEKRGKLTIRDVGVGERKGLAVLKGAVLLDGEAVAISLLVFALAF